MTTERFHRIEELYIAAHALPTEQRTGFVMTTCADDAELASEVITLLARDARTVGLADLCTPTDPSPDEAGHPVAPGATFGAYQIIEELGRGSMGIVYRATQTHPHRQVALKLLHAGYAPDEVRHRFGVEAEMLARLNHRGIAQIYAAGTVSTPHGSQPYIAMELVDGQPLLTYARAMRLDTSARVALLALICDAVEHAHQHGVIHSDLKPAHILVVDEPRGPRPVILDFGVARLMNPDQAAATRSTRHGQIIGTPAYMSPEQVDGNPAGIDTRCDVYALGAIGYELLAGRLPIDVDTASLHAGLHAILDRPIKPLASHGRQFGGDLSRVIGQALAKNKAQRYGSVAALAADLRNVLAHRPISARPPRAFYVLAKLARRHRLTTASFCLGAVLAVAGLVRAHLAQQALQNHYTETRDVAAFLAREFADQLDEIGGTNVVRRALLLRLRAQVEHLLRYDPHDPKLLTAYGDVLQNLSNIEMAEGAYEAALALRQEAVALCRQLAAGQPDDLERQADLSIALVLVGDILADWGDFATTRALFEEAAAIDEQIVRQMPDSRRFQSNLLWSYVRLAQVMDHLDDLAAVTAHVAAAEQKVQEILTRDPQNTDALHAGMCLTAFVIDRRAKLGRAAEYAELSRTFSELRPPAHDAGTRQLHVPIRLHQSAAAHQQVCAAGW